MVRRMARSDMPNDPAAAMGALRTCRTAMLDVQKGVRPTGAVYHGAQMVVSAIDAFATLLTGQRYYFGIEGSVGGHDPLGTTQDKQARETGEKPWDP